MMQIKHMFLLFIFIYKLHLSTSYKLRLRECDLAGGPRSTLYRRLTRSAIADMVRVAQDRLRDLNTLLDTWYGHDDLIPGLERSTQYTYEALFGTVYTGKSDPEGHFQDWLFRYRFYQVQDRLDKLQEIILGEEFVHVYCYDSFLISSFPNFIRTENLPPHTYWDSRLAVGGGRVLRTLPTFARCSEDPVAGNVAFMSTIPRNRQRAGTIILCPQNFRAPDTTEDMIHGKRLQGLRPLDFYKEDALFHLEQITYRNAIFIFLVLLGQLPLNGNEPMKPVKLDPVAGRQVFGWQAATLLALVDPEKAKNNPESYAYLIFALYLDRNDWSVGTALPMLPTTNGITHFYYSMNTQYEALVRNGNGPDEPPPMDWTVD